MVRGKEGCLKGGASLPSGSLRARAQPAQACLRGEASEGGSAPLRAVFERRLRLRNLGFWGEEPEGGR